MKKRMLAFLLSVVVAASMFSACGGDAGGDTDQGGTGQASTTETSDSQGTSGGETADSLSGRVKSVNGSTITLITMGGGGMGGPGGMSGNGMGAGPEKPDGEEGNSPDVSGNGMGGPGGISGNGMGGPGGTSGNGMGGPGGTSGNGMGGPGGTSGNGMGGRPDDVSGNGEGNPPEQPGGGQGNPADVSGNGMGSSPDGNGGGQGSMSEEREITVNEDTAYEIEENGETKDGSLDDIQEDTMIQVTLDEDGSTAISVTIMQGSSGGEAQGMELSGAKTIDGKKVSSSDETFSSTSDDENVILVANKGSLQLAGASLDKSGDTSNEDNSNFYGLNAALAVAGGSVAELTNVEIRSSGEGSNAIFATGEDSSIKADTVKIHTKENSARGLDATYGGEIDASNVDITTEGAHCAALATDRGGGTITVKGATLSTSGEGSPCFYSTGDITASDTEGEAAGSQCLVVEGKNSISLTDCEVKGAGENGLMLYQSTSGDAEEGTAVLYVTDSKLKTSSGGPMIYVTNTTAEATLTGTRLSFPGDVLVNVSGNETNNWGTPGQNGGKFTLTGIRQELRGDVACDGISTVQLVLSENSSWKGAMDKEGTGKEASLQLDDSSTWEVTADSYLSSLSNTQETCTNIQSNGYTVYYDASNTDNGWLEGRELQLPGGGLLTPMAG